MGNTFILSGDKPKEPTLPTPAAGPRPGKGPMKEAELQTLMSGLITSAVQYVDSELSPERAKATKYYKGDPFGNEETGRSQFVVTEVRDGVLGVIPGMLKVIFGPERAVEFRPRGAEDVDGAALKTDYVQYIFAEENPGFIHTLANIKDGLIRKTGAWKWWWDDTSSTTNHKAENVDQEGLEMLGSDEEVKITRVTQTGTAPAPPADPSQPPPPPIALHTVEFTHTTKDGRPKFGTIPSEEVLWNRDARSQEEAIFFAHRTRKPNGELIEMGIKESLLDEFGGDDSNLVFNEEAVVRTVIENINTTQDTNAGKANDRTLYIESYTRIDYDGDGIAELRKICTIGTTYHIVHNEPCDHVPMAVWCPDPEPHTLIGQSYADRLMDIQRYKSMLFRGISDSMAASIFPRTWYKEGDANLADVLNTAIGAPIRTKSGPNAVGEFAHTFKGAEGLSLIQYVDDMVEKRTGRPNGAAGIDADALQSSTKTAVAATVTASQAQQEMLVRIFAECALKPLFKGLLRLLVTHQPRARMVRLKNQWVTVDPRDWDADMDVQVNVALGSGFIDDKVETLMGIAQEQKDILAQLGPQNPICGMKEYRDTLAEIAELRGKKDSTRYFKPITKEDEQKMAEQAANTPPPKSPEQQAVEAKIQLEQARAQDQAAHDKAKTEREFALKQAEMAMRWKEIQMTDARERAKQIADDDRERDKQAAEIALKTRELELDHMVRVNEMQVNQDIEMARATSQKSPIEGAAPPKSRTVTINRHPETDALTGWTEEQSPQ